MEASLAWDAPPLVTDRLWSRVTGVQVAVAASGEQQWATFTALFDDFAGTLGELAATVAAVLA